jgi:hypothetical protein
MIEAALRKSGGQVSRPSGAATKLGLPGPTLESKVSKEQQEALLQIPQQIAFKYLPQRAPEHSCEISQTLRKFATWMPIKPLSCNNLTLAL